MLKWVNIMPTKPESSCEHNNRIIGKLASNIKIKTLIQDIIQTSFPNRLNRKNLEETYLKRE